MIFGKVRDGFGRLSYTGDHTPDYIYGDDCEDINIIFDWQRQHFMNQCSE